MKTLVFDIETHSADLLYTLPPEVFFRIGGYKWVGDKEVTLTTDLEEMRRVIIEADLIIGHNINSFDLPAVFGVQSDIPWELAMEERVLDTWTHAVLANPAPHTYINRFGQTALADKPEKMQKWFALDEQAYQLGVQGKTHDLKELAFEFGNPDLPQKERINDGFGKIPLDDERFRGYLIGDVEASEAVARELLKLMKMGEYAYREQKIAACASVIRSNGFRLDTFRAKQRINELAARRRDIMSELQEKYELPSEGASPWDTDQGKRAILQALADHGITPKTVNWPATPVAKKRGEKLAEVDAKVKKEQDKIREWELEIAEDELPQRSVDARTRWIEAASDRIAALRAEPLPPYFGLSLSGDALIAITAGTGAEDLGLALAELKGQRSLAQLALDSVHPDGMVHPDITMLQRSGRWSTTRPGLTVWTSRGDGAVEKEYFIPDNEDEVLLEIDYSNADARAVASMSGDTHYAERFEPGADGHMINAIAAWGEDVVATDPAGYRQRAKVPGHGWGYRVGAGTLSLQTGMDPKEAKRFLDNMNAAFKLVVKWQEKATRFAAQRGYVKNDWGRMMVVEKGREFTQAPALLGQSTTREIVCDALIRMPLAILRMVKAQIHDALVLSVPRERFDVYRTGIMQMMEGELNPPGGLRMPFPVSAGQAGENWYAAGH